MKRKVLAAVLIFAMLFTLMPTAAFAVDTHKHCVCGGNTSVGDHTSHSDIEFTPWNRTDSMPTEAGKYVLMDDVTITETWKPTIGVTTLCLNGHTLTYSGNANNEAINITSAENIAENRTLNICDCSNNSGEITGGKNSGIVVGENSVLNLYNGKICNNSSPYTCGGIYLNRSTFNMYGGAVSNNSAKNGDAGGLMLDVSSNFNMYGGIISANTASNSGGGVFVTNSATFKMQNGIISENQSGATGGGVWSAKTATTSISGDAVITGNIGSGTTNNLHLASDGTTDAKITIGTMGTNASVGVSVDSGHGMVISNGGKDDAAKFFSDSGAYAVTVDGENLKLVCNHSASTNKPTCTNTATCSVCGDTIRTIAHHYTELKKNDTQHWYECSVCDDEESSSRESHKGGTATCASKAKCALCSQEYGSLDTSNHNYSSTWTQTTDEHYYECSRCTEMKDKAAHDYTNACDTDCNTCGYVRTITHTFGSDNICDVCGYTKPTTNSGGGFSGTYNYPVAVADNDGADVTLSEEHAIEGEMVTITVTPESGKQVDEVMVTDEDGEVIAVTKVGDNQYTFTMPKGKVQVAVTTEAIDYDNKIVMQIGNKNIIVDNRTITNDVAPLLQGDRTLVPIRVIIEALGGSVDWNDAARTVTIIIDGKVLTLVIDAPIPGFGQGATIIDNRTYVPIRYVAEYVGAHVEWIAESQQIVILR